MAIDWTPVTSGLVGLTGIPEYRVEDDGTVKWRGIVTLTITSGTAYFTIPAPATPHTDSYPLYVDWGLTERSLNILNPAHLYVRHSGTKVIGAQYQLHPLTYQGPIPPAPVVAHSLANVRAGIAARLRTLTGLRVYDFPSDRVEPPAAVLSMPETPYDVTLDGRTDLWTFPLWVLVAKADDKASYGEMGAYLEAEGPLSIRAAIESDRTLGGACDTAAVTKARPLFATVAGTEFLAVEFTLEVYT